MLLECVDLASVCWGVYLSDGREVRREWSAAAFPSEDQAIDSITYLFRPESKLTPAWMIVEDLPHHVMPNVSVKDVTRMQGRIIDRMYSYGHRDKILFVQPMEWQKHFKLVRAGDKGFEVFARERFGYTPPNLIESHKRSFTSLKGTERQKVRSRLQKLMGDHIAAFLIYQWAVEVGEEKMLESKSVQRPRCV